jgi:hypothetical protein
MPDWPISSDRWATSPRRGIPGISPAAQHLLRDRRCPYASDEQRPVHSRLRDQGYNSLKKRSRRQKAPPALHTSPQLRKTAGIPLRGHQVSLPGESARNREPFPSPKRRFSLAMRRARPTRLRLFLVRPTVHEEGIRSFCRRLRQLCPFPGRCPHRRGNLRRSNGS